ncbi:hypothetical protein MTO96_033242 [Rhipicephalus appendiculatus]
MHSVEVQQKRDHAVMEPEGGRPLPSVQEQRGSAEVVAQSGEGAQRGDCSSVHATGEAQGLSERTCRGPPTTATPRGRRTESHVCGERQHWDCARGQKRQKRVSFSGQHSAGINGSMLRWLLV